MLTLHAFYSDISQHSLNLIFFGTKNSLLSVVKGKEPQTERQLCIQETWDRSRTPGHYEKQFPSTELGIAS